MRTPVDVSLNNSLAALGLWRKPTAEDSSSLFRAVAEQVYHTQSMYWRVRVHCISHLKWHRIKYAAIFGPSFEQHIVDVENGKTAGGQIEIEAISNIYRRDILVYQNKDKTPIQATNHGFKEKILLCFSNGRHYDSIYPITYPDHAAFCQALLYEILYEKVFNVENITNIGHEAMKRFHLPQDDTDAAKISPSSACSNNSSNNSSKSHSPDDNNNCISNENSMFVPYKLAKSLCVKIYRNIEFELWLEEKRELKQYGVYDVEQISKDISPGDHCLITMENDGDGQVLHVHVQQIAYDQKLATVYVVELGERIDVPTSSLKLALCDEETLKADTFMQGFTPATPVHMHSNDRRYWNGRFPYRNSFDSFRSKEYSPRAIRGGRGYGFFRGHNSKHRPLALACRSSSESSVPYDDILDDEQQQTFQNGFIKKNNHPSSLSEAGNVQSSEEETNENVEDNICRELNELNISTDADVETRSAQSECSEKLIEITEAVPTAVNDGNCNISVSLSSIDNVSINGCSTPLHAAPPESFVESNTAPTANHSMPLPSHVSLGPIQTVSFPVMGFEHIIAPINIGANVSMDLEGRDLPLSAPSSGKTKHSTKSSGSLLQSFSKGLSNGVSRSSVAAPICFHSNFSQLVHMHQYHSMSYGNSMPMNSMHPSNASNCGYYETSQPSQRPLLPCNVHGPSLPYHDVAAAGPPFIMMPRTSLPTPSSSFIQPPLPPMITLSPGQQTFGMPYGDTAHMLHTRTTYADTAPVMANPTMYGARMF